DELDDYVMDRMIGFGGFSTVRRGFCISDGHHVAIKIIKFDAAAASAEEDGALPLLLERELSIWKSLCHPNIVCLQKILETDHALYLICDYCSGGSLLSKVKEAHSHGGGGGGWSELEARGIFRDVCQAVSYLHEEAKVCHKDLKLENILLDDQAHCAKVCDFGLALPFGCASSSSSSSAEGRPGGSLAYMSPEQLTTSSTTPTMTSPSSDIWSLGVILYAMVTGKLPFWDEYELRLQQKILIGQYPEPNNASSDVQTLIRGCLNRDPQKRWTIKQVLASSWLK
ncbi:kinase-like domain-containing protein, partial [Mycotypha africana]|uniref:kinase-like domain-containing protein n=1 Tax=Mycotypha africana TaxID=64632 RepID=UPI002300A6B9